MAGMPQKMLEHLLETRLDARNLSTRDEDIIRPYSSATDMFLDDFLLTQIMFIPPHQLITELMRKYPFYYMFLSYYRVNRVAASLPWCILASSRLVISYLRRNIRNHIIAFVEDK